MEFRRAAIRIASNYVRLLATLVVGLYLVRVLLATVGEEGYGLVALLVSTVSIVVIVEEAASWSMIRELGAAHHGGDRTEFHRMFNSAVKLCLYAAGGIVLIFMGILLALPLMDISPALLPAARWFVVAKAIETGVLVLLSPQFNMYLVLERMAAYNFWLVARRFTGLAAAASLFWFADTHDPSRGLIIFGWLSAALMILTMAISAAIITVQDRRLIPHLPSSTSQGMKAFVSISGWNIAIQASQTLAFPAGAIIMNLGFGLIGNMLYGFATQLGGYARMIASGMTYGLDAVATRMSTGAAGAAARDMHQLVRYSTMLHGLAAFPAMAILGVLAHPLLVLWVGSKVQDSQSLDQAATMMRVLLIAFGIMVLCECWTRILFGAGFVRSYAPLVIIGNICTPFVATALLFILPQPVRYTAVAWALSLIYSVFYLGFIPRKTATALGMGYWEVLSPLIRPLVCSAVCVPVLVAFVWGVRQWNLVWIAAAVLAYGAMYALLVWLWVLQPAERARLTAALPIRRPVPSDVA